MNSYKSLTDQLNNSLALLIISIGFIAGCSGSNDILTDDTQSSNESTILEGIVLAQSTHPSQVGLRKKPISLTNRLKMKESLVQNCL